MNFDINAVIFIAFLAGNFIFGKAAIEAHGGDIKVRSEGIGATFMVLLSTS